MTKHGRTKHVKKYKLKVQNNLNISKVTKI